MNPAPNITLIGPMGAGKSSVGRRIASRFGLRFVDADRHLEQATGTTIPVIFECEGEAGFRKRESEILDELLQQTGLLIATGGGAVLSAENREKLSQRSFVIYLRITVEEQLVRLSRDTQRPLLKSSDRKQTLEKMAEIRNPLYEQTADMVFDSGSASISHAIRRLTASLQVRWRPLEKL